jgi:hypothetical protein
VQPGGRPSLAETGCGDFMKSLEAFLSVMGGLSQPGPRQAGDRVCKPSQSLAFSITRDARDQLRSRGGDGKYFARAKCFPSRARSARDDRIATHEWRRGSCVDTNVTAISLPPRGFGRALGTGGRQWRAVRQ